MSDRTAIEWTFVPGYSGYAVNRAGQISGPSRLVLKPLRKQSGHLYVTTGRRGERKNLMVHHAVLLTYVGPAGEGKESRHLNGDPSDNRLENLAWGDRLEQRADDRRHGVRRGRPQALTAEDAAAIRDLKDKASSRVVGRRFGVSHTGVLRIWKGEIWATEAA